MRFPTENWKYYSLNEINFVLNSQFMDTSDFYKSNSQITIFYMLILLLVFINNVGTSTLIYIKWADELNPFLSQIK